MIDPRVKHVALWKYEFMLEHFVCYYVMFQVSPQVTPLHVAVSSLLHRLGVSCDKQVKEETLHAPSYNPADQSCTFQAMQFLFSCVAKDPARIRSCPCRDFQPQQVAFCKNCD